MSGAQRRAGGAPPPVAASGASTPRTSYSRADSMGGPAPSPGGRNLSRTDSLASAANASFAAAQELSSVMNEPAGAGGGWLAAWPFAQALVQEDYDAPPPPLPPGTLPEVTIGDFSRYLRSVGDRLETFERCREASQQRMQEALSPEELRVTQGQGLVKAMQEVPAPFFQESFDLDQRQLWEELIQVGSDEARQESLEKLSGWLDVVETHLVREIAARTDSFFDGSGYIQDVRGSALRLYQQVAGLRAQVHGLEEEVGAAVATSQRLQRRRINLDATLHVLRAMEGVAQAQSALHGLLPAGGGQGGVGVDYAGAIDVLEVLQGVLDDEALLALDCFKHLPDQISETAQAVDDLMSSDFLERTRLAGQATLEGGILDRLRLQVAAGAATPRRRRRASSSSSLPPSRQLSAEESAELEGLAALELTDSAAVNRCAAWLQRLAAGGGEAEAAVAAFMGLGPAEDGMGAEAEVLQDVLLPLVIGLRRMGRLPALMQGFKDAAAARLKDFLGQVIDGCLDILDPDGAPGDASHLVASHRSLSPGREREQPSTAERLQRLPGQDFQWLLEAVVLAVKVSLDHCTAVGDAVTTILAAAKAPKQQLAAAVRDAREGCQAVAEAAVGRWAKLLSGRARGADAGGGGTSGHTRLAELRGVLELTDVLASLVEQYGVRGVLGLRTALQQLCKASLDGMHAKALGKLTTLLEQEQWAVVEVPPQFQGITDELQQRGLADAVQAADAGAGLVRSRSSATQAGAAVAAPPIDGSASNGGGLSAAPEGESGTAAPGGPIPRKYTITPHDGTVSSDTQQQQQQHQQPFLAQQEQLQGQQQSPNGVGPARTLVVEGLPFHVVNTELLLLSMLRDYLDFRDAVPAFAAEVAQRVLELLKVFNSRTCQLVLGAGAMQVSGLKSITAKHLAISCQCLGALMALHPTLFSLFMEGVMPPRRDMLAADFGRVLQDYRIHHEEVCSKLVSIMRERLSANIKQLPALAAAWPAGGERPELPAPSGFATTAAKQLQILSSALSPLLLPNELHAIFGRIGLMFSRTLAEAYELLEPHGAAWEQQLRADMQFMLNCLRNLPMDSAERDANLERLTLLFERRFLLSGAPPPAVARPAAAAAVPIEQVEPPRTQPAAAPTAAAEEEAVTEAPAAVALTAGATAPSATEEQGDGQLAAAADGTTGTQHDPQQPAAQQDKPQEPSSEAAQQEEQDGARQQVAAPQGHQVAGEQQQQAQAASDDGQGQPP